MADDFGISNVTTSRRGFLAGGGALIVSFSMLPQTLAQTPPAAPPPLPGSLRVAPFLDSWIRINADGSVGVLSGKAELGQGIRTALIQVASEHLNVPVASIKLTTADTARTANEGFTAGSMSMVDSGTAIMHAASQAREILIQLAAKKIDKPAETLKAENGFVVAEDGTRVAYGDLVAGEELHVQATPNSKLKDPASFTIVGTDFARVDIPAKVTGGAAYVQDMRPPGMVHARVVRPPSYGAKLQSVDTAAVEKMPGVKKVVRDGNYLAVIADGEFRAIKAMEVLRESAKWQESETMPQQASFYDWLKKQPGRVITDRDVRGLSAPAAKSLQAEYKRPYQMHGSIGPSCGLAQFVDGELTVWSHAQGMFPLRDAIAQLVKLPQDKVRCIHVEGSGCYGHNGADDAAADAALLAVAYPGVPVRVQWMRDQEHQWEPYGSGMVMDVRASVDDAGKIVEWDYSVWTDTHGTRPGGAGSTLAGQSIAQAFTLPPPSPGSLPTGSGDRNIIPLYVIPNMRLIYNFIPHLKLRVSSLRGLGAYANVFAIESFMDELALAAGIDPVEFRLRNLTDQRAIDVIRLTAEKFGWKAGEKLPEGRGRGFAFAKYKNLEAWCAVAIELDVAHETGAVKLRRAVAAVDSGQAVNPDGMKNQIAGGIVQSASWTLQEMVEFDPTRIKSRDWVSYPILRFDQMFDELDVHVINRPGERFLGTGEASQGPTSAAIANAIFDATKARIRELPFTARRVKEAVGV